MCEHWLILKLDVVTLLIVKTALKAHRLFLIFSFLLTQVCTALQLYSSLPVRLYCYMAVRLYHCTTSCAMNSGFTRKQTWKDVYCDNMFPHQKKGFWREDFLNLSQNLQINFIACAICISSYRFCMIIQTLAGSLMQMTFTELISH